MTARQQLQYWAIALIAFIGLLWLLRGIMLPFVAGMAIAYFLDPVADEIEKRGAGRGLATTIVLAVFFLLVVAVALLMLPVLHSQVVGFVERLPGYVTVVRDYVVPYVIELAGRVDFDLANDTRAAIGEMAKNAVQYVVSLVGSAISGGLALFNLLSLLVVTPIVAFYLLRDYDRMVEKVDSWLPRQHAATIRTIMTDIDDVLAGFVRGQGTVCLILGISYGVALTLVGLEFGLLIGLFSGFLSFVPFVGAILGLLLSMLTAITQFLPDGDFLRLGLTAAIFFAGQALEGNVLTPKLLGSHIGLHPVWVMFALFAGGALFGFVGILIAVPVAAAVGVLVRFMLNQYLRSRLYAGLDDSTKPGTDG